MGADSTMKKIFKKQKKLQHVVMKETGVQCIETPSKFLAICNAGLVSGLREETIVKHFAKHGNLETILLLPGKSCSFVSYREVCSAVDAFNAYSGILCIAQNNKPIYLSFVQSLPDAKQEMTWNVHPPGLIILEDFVSSSEEVTLLALCNIDDEPKSSQMKHRNVRHFGYEFRYDINNVDKEQPLPEKLPSQCDVLWQRLKNTDLPCKNFEPDQLTVNHYIAGQGIPPHVDTHSAFEDPIVSLSLHSPIVMEFRNEKLHCCVLLPRRSLAIMSGEARYDWTHGITPRKYDVIFTKNGYTTLERSTRVSFTFRKVLRGNCNCNFKRMCDCRDPQDQGSIKSKTASQLEKLYVQDVYENIATHFSDTRHTPWPNVLEFVMSFRLGDLLVDLGCGNGKYLGHNRNIFELGCDSSFNLIDVCKSRGFEAFTGNCLNVPIKDYVADGVISIAVIHHLANECYLSPKERRLQALKEIVRVLRMGGRALVYVWAKNQQNNNKKSSYLKQNRKNLTADIEYVGTSDGIGQITTSVDGVTLPIHMNRTQFKHCDMLVPWKLKEDQQKNTFYRFYHVFEEMELDGLCMRIDGVEIVKSYYDQGNWCVILEKK